LPARGDGLSARRRHELPVRFRLCERSAQRGDHPPLRREDDVTAARPSRDGDLVRVLKSAGPLSVTDKAGVLLPATFSLKGSSKAIGKVERACYS
jgi:hypothetical protein